MGSYSCRWGFSLLSAVLKAGSQSILQASSGMLLRAESCSTWFFWRLWLHAEFTNDTKQGARVKKLDGKVRIIQSGTKFNELTIWNLIDCSHKTTKGWGIKGGGNSFRGFCYLKTQGTSVWGEYPKGQGPLRSKAETWVLIHLGLVWPLL